MNRDLNIVERDVIILVISNEIKSKKITVVTPTYNREHTLKRCYDSLVNQTSYDFKWVVVDDGSSDNTRALINGFILENKIELEYHFKENGGKAAAINFALNKLNTPYYVCLDSDDWFHERAIENALQELNNIKGELNICGFLALRNTSDGKVFGGKRIPQKVEVCTVMDITDKYLIKSEYIQFYNSKVIKKYRFPEINSEKFISSEFISREINKKFKFKVSQGTFCYCEYLEDGLSLNKVKVIKENPIGYTTVKYQTFELSPTVFGKIKHGIMTISGFLMIEDEEYKKIFKNKIKNNVLLLTLIPVGFVVKKLRFD